MFHIEGLEVIEFQEIDFATVEGENEAHVKVTINVVNSNPFTIRIHPVTLSQYRKEFGGAGCAALSFNVNPAEGMIVYSVYHVFLSSLLSL